MSELTILTTQNVTINFKQASIGERMLAFLLDMIIKLAYVFGFSYLFFDLFGFNEVMNRLDSWSQFAVLILIFSPYIFYSLALESIFEGQTLGKRIVRIKVVKIEGYQAGFGDYLIRWLFRIVDVAISTGLIGLLTMIFSNKTQRLGDISAGTAVVSLKNDVSINHTILQEINQDYMPTYPLVIKLSDNDIRIIKETFEVARTNNNQPLIRKLVEKVETVTGMKNQSGNNHDFIRTVLKDYSFYTQHM